MKKLIMFWLVLILSSSIYGQTAKFYEKILSDTKCRYCYFVSLNIQSEFYSGKIVVENGDLFDYFKLTKNFDEKEYKEFMLKLLQENQKLVINGITVDDDRIYLIGKNLKKSSFRIVETSQPFENVSARSCKEFIQYYFAPSLLASKEDEKNNCKEIIKQNAKDLLIKPKFDRAEENNVISKLFDLGIPVHTDDVSGSLRIGYLALDYDGSR